MAGRSNNQGRGGGVRGNSNRATGGRGGRGGNHHRKPTSKVGLVKELEGNVFDLGERSSANLMRTTQIKIAHYVGHHYGGDTMKELQTRTEFVVPPAEYPALAVARKPAYKVMHKEELSDNIQMLEKKMIRLEGEIEAIVADPKAEKKLEEEKLEVKHAIAKAKYELTLDVVVPLNEIEKADWKKAKDFHNQQVTKHHTSQQKAFAVIIGQCTTRLQDKMIEDADWDTINKEQKPLKLYKLIEKVVMTQTGDEYEAASIVDHLLSVLTLKMPNNVSCTQGYEKFNTHVDVAESVGVHFDIFRPMWEYCCEVKKLGGYDSLTAAEQDTIRADSKERLLAYVFIKNSKNTPTHEQVRNNLVEAFIAKRDEYPATRSDALALLNKYDEKNKGNNQNAAASKGTAIAQKGKKGGGKKDAAAAKKQGDDGDTDKKNPHEKKECYVCNKKGHIAKRCPNRGKEGSSDDSSISSKSSSKNKLKELEKTMKNAFSQIKATIEEDEDSSDDEQSHFQFLNMSLMNTDQASLQRSHDRVVFKQSNGKLSKLNLRIYHVIVLQYQVGHQHPWVG